MIDTTSACFYELYDEEVYKEFIKNVEREFRKSPEYNMWLATTGNEKCAITGLTKDSVEIQVHHYGKTLWDVVEDILDYFIQNDLNVNSFYICLILSDLHLNGCIDYIPLTYDLHKMVHKDPTLAKAKYPEMPEKVTRGNMELKEEIIKKWANRLKTNFTESSMEENKQ